MPPNQQKKTPGDSKGSREKRGSSRTRIREIRRAKGLTLAQVASGAGITPSYLQKMESGARRANLDVLHRIASAMGVADQDLIRSRDEPLESTTYGTGEGRRPVLARDLPVANTIIVGSPDVELSAGEMETFSVLPHLWSPQRYVLRIHEDSMYPTLQPGDLVLVENRGGIAASEVEGRACTVLFEGQGLVKRVFTVRRAGVESVVLKGDNAMFPPVSVGRGKDFSIQGICLELVSRSLI